MKQLIELLNRASKAYYAEDREIMSNFEYDRLYDELTALEEETGITLAGSPTVSVGFEAVEDLPKERHESPMLSLSKTKSRQELADWLGDQEGLLSWKLDGLTIVLTYEAGSLKKAVTRGNGEVGEVITPNARTFVNLPQRIPYKGKLILRGEAVIPYSVFEKINATIPEEDAKYKNPRNLCSGSVRQLSSEVTAARQVSFYAFSFVSASGSEVEGFDGKEPDFANDREKQFEFLKSQGFDVVEYVRVNASNVEEEVESFARKITGFDIPSDGLVLTLCDLMYSASLGRTAKFPRDSIAFKWADETAETILREVEWSPSRTGLINPVAVFDPVELEGTTVSRASLHNISIMRQLRLGIGDRVTVYKANMIIPQIAENLTGSNVLPIPDACPACGGSVKITGSDTGEGAEVLYCTDPDCPAKKIKGYSLFVSRDAMNVDGLSEMTLEKLLGRGFIKEYADLYHLDDHKDEIVKMEGFGEKSYENLTESIARSARTTMPRLIYALGITGIGVANAKMLSRHFSYDPDSLMAADIESLSAIDGIGEVLAKSIRSYFDDEENSRKLANLRKELTLQIPEEAQSSDDSLSGKTFVITGDVHHFANRSEVKSLIESKGGKVTGSVTGKTDYLINNDITSTSGKNKKAKELGIPIISEEDFLAMIEA
ncbi:MAG: NAD-dependent DNA ligase LigA [Lachnospiraceae bacterium]|nr:NAD-dependent DNA ligase LigA [Lachnospiraceae bacterium]